MNQNKPIRILIADDHPVVREGLKHIIAEDPDMVVTDEASTGSEVLEKVWENDYDIVLLDLRMPDGEGLENLRMIKKQKPSLPVLVITVYPEDDYGVRSLRAGASGYVTKERATKELTSAIRTVLSGKKYINPTMAERLAASLDETVHKMPHECLSDREYQIMRLITAGKRAKDIADELSLSIKTVSTYRARILEKMKMQSNAELIRYALENRLTD